MKRSAARDRSRTGLARYLSHFRRDEDGGLIIFSMFIFVLMLIAGGMAVDFMRFESHRVRLQGTLDRAVLAAADIDQTRPAIEVVQDYFDKARLPASLNADDIKIETGLGSRQVSASATLNVPSMFLRLLGHDKLTAPASATAEEVVPHLEISMVLDVSGSMSGEGITRLREASKTFIQMVIPEPQVTADSLTTVSVVPYSMSVNMGARLASEFAMSGEHDFSNCAEFTAADFNSLGLTPGQSLDRYAHFSQSSDTEDHPGYANSLGRVTPTFCRRAVTDAVMMGSSSDTVTHDPDGNPSSAGVYETNAIAPWMIDAGELIATVNNLQPNGGTAIDDGLRWGVALLAPEMLNMASSLELSGDIDDLTTNVPRAHDPNNVSKALVLMTDGKMDAERYINELFQDGWSNVWYDPVRNRHSLLVRGPGIQRIVADSDLPNDSRYDDTRDHLWYHTDRRGSNVYDYPDTDDGSSFPDCMVGDVDGDGDEGDDARDCFRDNGLERLRNVDVTDRWRDYSARYYVYYYPRYYGHISSPEWNLYDVFVTYTVSDEDREARLGSLCTLAKADPANITIFSVAIDSGGSSSPTTDTLNMLENCSSGEEYFFHITAEEVEAAFATIARRVTALRLAR